MAKNIADNKTDGIVFLQFRLFYYCISIQYLLYEITSSADFRFFSRSGWVEYPTTMSRMTRFLSGICSSLRMAFSSNQPSMQLPNPSAVAARVMCAAAIPMSSSGNCLSLMSPPMPDVKLGRSSTTRICTGACLVKWFMPNMRLATASATWFRNSGSSTTMKCHGCALQAEGAIRAASRIRRIFRVRPDVRDRTGGRFAGG